MNGDILLMAEILHHLGNLVNNGIVHDISHINWCRISSINSSSESSISCTETATLEGNNHI